MSDAIGPVFYEHRSEHPFLGQRLASESALGDAATNLIDAEVQRALGAAVAEARAVVQKHRDKLDRLVQALLDRETVDHDEIASLLMDAPASAAAGVS